MKVWAMWHGGFNYSYADDDDDLEVFPSLQAAKDAHFSRYRHGGWIKQEFRYVHRLKDDVFTPCVDQSSEMWIYFHDPSDDHDPYPDRVISIGPFDGIRVGRV